MLGCQEIFYSPFKSICRKILQCVIGISFHIFPLALVNGFNKWTLRLRDFGGNSLEADDQSCRLRVNIRNVLKRSCVL